MKHVSIWLAIAVSFAIGYAAGGANSSARPSARPAPGVAAAAQAQRPPARPTEDPKAVYRVPIDGSPVKGPADALVTIVESSDFECPFCKRAAPTLKSLEEQYRGKVRFVFKHNPLPFHARATPAAIAAEEARAQGGDAKFWAMHDALFAAPALDEAAILLATKDAGLDAAKMKAALEGGRHKERLERDQKLVQGLGATGTPSFFVNGRKLVGAQPLPAFQALVDEELKKAEELVRGGTPAAQVYAKITDAGASAPVFVAGEPGAAAPAQPPPAAPSTVYRAVPVRADDPARGPADARLTVVLFSDFQCPFCGKVEPSLAELEKAFPGKVRVVWKHQPLPMHPNAVPASLAAEAAREQGKFWPMHDKLFASQQALSPDLYRAAAKELGLDVRRFEQATSAKKGEGRIQEDQKLGNEVGANGTPTMFFNCRQVVGAQPFERLRAFAEEELKKADQVLGPAPAKAPYERLCKANVAAAPAVAQAVPSAAPVPAVALAPADLTLRPDDPVRGNPKAPVTIVLFSDFQCPFCSRVGPTLDEAQRVYGDKVRVVWKHQPLQFHPNALPAAKAAEAAREQGKFWPMHDRLFAAQRELSPDTYDRIAKDLGLDLRRFQESIRAAKGLSRIEEDQRLAARVGAQGTPTMYVNGEKVEGAVPFATLKAVIDRKLGM
ncbi:MAG TPA: thioredoxin domain-containing protein [Anaeromyxobacter sp.]